MPIGFTKLRHSFRRMGRKPSQEGLDGESEEGTGEAQSYEEWLAEVKKTEDSSGSKQSMPYLSRSGTTDTTGSHSSLDHSLDNRRSESPANSFDSIDTISDMEAEIEDAEVEKNRRTRKLLKYSLWKDRSSNSQNAEKNTLSLERKVARQEMKLNALDARERQREQNKLDRDRN
ncbi:hypothetical protein FA15DRAFT_663974 [Coprinopsis marcescibilis]|uniref:Uncharacterized protein n=1 Tax=Coprinopsis marcescibilis TaxID=230819 RepID=A0A5C3L9R1_COPMA|nr:hypothetical protein FA15DRAFT_663974 [Coprinopsis marcescibilis]